jgi:hypothetical protein
MLAAAMARRRIRQDCFPLSEATSHGGTSLDATTAQIDWSELDRLLTDISASA